jgi:hypothetical protein
MATITATGSLRGMTREPPRLLFMVAILLGHGLIVYLLLDRTGMLRAAATGEELWSRVYISPLSDRRAPSPPSTVPDNPAKADTRRSSREVKAFVPGPIVEQVPLITPKEPAPSDTSPSIDWSREAEDAARRAVLLGANDRDFSDSTKDETRPRRKIEEAPKTERGHRAGDIEMVGPGIERRWVSENCFWEFGRPPPLFAGPLPRIHQVQCKLGPADPNSHLFDEIKPRYLKKQD